MLFGKCSANEYRFIVRKPVGTKPLETYRRKLKDNIKMDLEDIKCEDVDRIHWDCYVNTVIPTPVLVK
jgi:hypothetical protein